MGIYLSECSRHCSYIFTFKVSYPFFLFGCPTHHRIAYFELAADLNDWLAVLVLYGSASRPQSTSRKHLYYVVTAVQDVARN